MRVFCEGMIRLSRLKFSYSCFIEQPLRRQGVVDHIVHPLQGFKIVIDYFPQINAGGFCFFPLFCGVFVELFLDSAMKKTPFYKCCNIPHLE